jgi:hypothetical protein
MTRDEAVSLVQHLYTALGVESAGLNEQNLGGAMIEDMQVYFEYKPDKGVLDCLALIYKFTDEPRPGILEEFAKEEASGKTDTGGGTLSYQPENRGLYLLRRYSERVPDADFINELGNLLAATRTWGGEVLERVSTKVFHA